MTTDTSQSQPPLYSATSENNQQVSKPTQPPVHDIPDASSVSRVLQLKAEKQNKDDMIYYSNFLNDVLRRIGILLTDGESKIYGSEGYCPLIHKLKDEYQKHA
jgi:hypothetical protein